MFDICQAFFYICIPDNASVIERSLVLRCFSRLEVNVAMYLLAKACPATDAVMGFLAKLSQTPLMKQSAERVACRSQ